jgi:transcriptional regulator of arginine metabolism
MKLERHAAILRAVREQRIGSQHELREALAARGIDVTQATLSRDLRELGLAKQADPGGGAFYIAPAEGPSGPELGRLLGTFVVSMDGHEGLLVLRTSGGGAPAVAAALDAAAWPEIRGTLARSDTVLGVARGEEGRKSVMERVERERKA